MDPIDLAESFIEYSEAETRIEQLSLRFQHGLQDLGFRYFACSTHVDPLDPRQGITLLNYPREWVEWYSEKQLHLIDPVFKRADRTRRSFYWDDPAFLKSMSPRQRKMQVAAGQFGVAHGFTVPIHSPMSSASCSVVPDSSKITRRSYTAVALMSMQLFDRVERIQHPCEPLLDVCEFSPRERQCLYFAAAGKTDEELALLLGLRKSTAHNYVESAKKRLSMSHRIQAIVYAIGTRQIRVEDIMRQLHRIASQSRH